MFDQFQKSQSDNGAAPQPAPAVPPTPPTPPTSPAPANLPQAPVEEKKVEDIFGHLDKEVPVQPTQPTPNMAGPLPPVGSTGSGKKLGLIIGIIIILLLILSAGAYWVWQNSANKSYEQTPKDLESDEAITDEGKGKTPPAEIIENIPVGVDSDSDGLMDSNEITLGTNPESADTDNDKLFDNDEVNIYQTNPLIADTDNDGYLDGEEVAGGFNPKGPGKLLNFQDELNKLNNGE